MTALIGLIWSRYSGTILIVAGALVVIAGVYGVGWWSAYSSGKVDQLKDSVEAYAKREGIDNDTDSLTRDALCRRLGGLPEQCNELRRMEEAPAGK
ncbi:hypothetical protein J2T08_000575 [Neorhizobium galegae]|uniref:hypothetical protein n=1 Tax=Neorhizobium galegae TaxID=399 RepID=UPI00278ACCA7|nr:hypothetical protein [Neorhizobium galegae]MDQ0132674.1 hypothetical protein [Neorhizobium galegae]